MPTKQGFVIASGIDPGVKRREKPNQDAIIICRPGFLQRKPPLIVLADGMGGYEGGRLASQKVVNAFRRKFLRWNKNNSGLNLLENAVQVAHRAIHKVAARDTRFEKMGSTVVAAILEEEEIHLINVGDSRAYLINEESITQISFDHSLVGELVRQKLITPTEALNHPKRSTLSLSLNAARDKVVPYTKTVGWTGRDTLLLCSDGLWSTVSEEQIKAVVVELPGAEAAKKLIDLANLNQGPDNISVIIAYHASRPSQKILDQSDLDQTQP